MDQDKPDTLDNVIAQQRGLLLVDKPIGPSSHDVVSWARKLIDIQTIGHTGTLDPLASGLLILLIGRQFTKLQINFLKQDKTYLVTGKLGETSDTYDVTGQLNSKNERWRDITKSQLRLSLNTFVGQLDQAVPPFSAVKIKGKKLYRLARKGKISTILLPTKSIIIYSIALLDFSPPFFTLEVSCSSGTYIRSLINDIGQTLQVGALVTALRRLNIGQYSIDQAQACPNFTRR